MAIYEYKPRTSRNITCENGYHHAALELGADIVRGLVQEGNVVKNGAIVHEGEFASVKIGPSAFSSDKTEIDATAIYFLTRLEYLPSQGLVLFTKDNKRVSVLTLVCGENSPEGLEARVSVVGEEEVLKRFESLATRCPRIVNDEQQQLEQS